MADMIGPFLAVLGSALVVTARAITDQRDGKIFLHVMLSMRSGRARGRSTPLGNRAECVGASLRSNAVIGDDIKDVQLRASARWARRSLPSHRAWRHPSPV